MNGAKSGVGPSADSLPRISLRLCGLQTRELRLMTSRSNMFVRPGTLAQALRLILDEGEPLRTCLVGFLDEFYFDRDPASRRARVEEAPKVIGDERKDAYIGAVGEHLCHRWNLGAPPTWTNDPARFLNRPWFIGPERMKAF